MLQSGLQAAVSWASLLCVYIVAVAISELYAKYFFFAIEFPIGIYRRSSLEGQGPPPPPMRTLGGRLSPCLHPPCSAAPARVLGEGSSSEHYSYLIV